MERGLLDSLELISLISHVEDVYGVTVPPGEYVPENFATARNIAEMIKRAPNRVK
jgi:acyl carrier protein